MKNTKMLFLCSELDIDNSLDDFARIIVSFPTILFLSKPTLIAKIDFLWSESRLDTDNYELEEIVLTTPSILSLSLENNLKPKLQFFTQSVGMTRWELKVFVLYQPVLLTYSLKNRIKPRMAHMETNCGKLSCIASVKTHTNSVHLGECQTNFPISCSGLKIALNEDKALWYAY